MKTIVKKAIYTVLQKKSKKRSNRCVIDTETAAPEEGACTYGIDCLIICVAENDSVSGSG